MRLRNQVIWSFGLKGLGAALALAVSWVIARLYGPVGSGLYAIGQTTVQVVGFVALLGLDSIMLRTMAGEIRVDRRDLARGAVRVAAKVAVPSALLATGLLLLLNPLIAAPLSTPGAARVLAIVAPAVIGIVLMRLTSFALRGAGVPLLSQSMEGPLTSGLAILMLAAIATAPVRPPIWSVSIVYTVAMLCTALFGCIMLWRRLRDWPAPEAPPLKPMLVAGVPVMISVVSGFAIDWLSTMLTSYFASPAAAGTLRVAAQTLLITSLVLSSFDAIIGPQIAASWKVGEKQRIASLLRKTILGSLAATAPIFAIVLIWPEFVMGLFGPEFVAGATALQIVAVGNIFALSGGPVGSLLIMSGHERWSVGFALASILVLVSLSSWLVPILGVTGAAIALTGSMIFRRLLAGLVVRYVVGIKIFDFTRPPPPQAMP
jgi:O-antigen/teichoic acid export membrane protein